MASSSTSPSHDDVYNVFINHHGPDVKKGLASHIYRRLTGHGLKVFLDQPEMQEGETITPQIKRAIRTASVHIAIFSKGYADSTWCLNELLDMLDTVKSGSTILPVFYNVQPSDLRWTRGGDRVYARALSIFLCILLSVLLCIPMSFLLRFLLCVPFIIIMCILLCTRGENGVYARALRKLHKKTTLDSVTNKKKPRHDSDTIEKWRKALSDVSLISGFELNAYNGDEGQLVDEVVQLVLEKVPKVHLPLKKGPDVRSGLASKVHLPLKKGPDVRSGLASKVHLPLKKGPDVRSGLASKVHLPLKKGPDVRSGLASNIYRRRIGHMPPQPGEGQLDPHVEAEQPGEVDQQNIDVGDQQPGDVEAQQSGAVQPDRIGLDQPDPPDPQDRISQTERAYSKVLKTTSTIYKIFLSFYGIMQVGILTVVFSSQQRKALCKDSWGLLVLSAIVSGGVLMAFLWNYCEQFLLLRRGRRLIQELHSSGISAVDLKVDDLEINTKYWSWIRERAAIVIAFMTLSICLWFSLKSRLSC